jgi:hypothetical protein
MTLMICPDMRGAGNEVTMRFAQSHDARQRPKLEIWIISRDPTTANLAN